MHMRLLSHDDGLVCIEERLRNTVLVLAPQPAHTNSISHIPEFFLITPHDLLDRYRQTNLLTDHIELNIVIVPCLEDYQQSLRDVKQDNRRPHSRA